MTASTVSVSRPGREARPGLRTFRSGPFRMVVATVLLVVGVAILGSAMVRQASDPAGQFAIDFADYHAAAQRLAAGDSPYAPDMLSGPIPAQGTDRYRYPPPFAQLLVPLAGLPLTAAASIWLLVQGVAVLAAIWIAGTAGGARRTPERLLWSAVAATWFLPVFDTLWKGNVSGIVALVVSGAVLGGSVAALGDLGGVALKLTPVALAPAAWLPASRRTLAITALVGGVALLISLLAAPTAWSDYLIVLPNLLAGPADYATNLAPAAVASNLGATEWVSAIVRAATLAIAVAALVASARVARRTGGLRAAVVLGVVAMLLIPSALWYHYLCVLLPIAALGWPAASVRARAGLLAGAALVVAALAWLPLAPAGAAVMTVAALSATWPRPPAVADPWSAASHSPTPTAEGTAHA